MTQALGAHLLRLFKNDMSLLRLLESWTEGLVRIVIGIGLSWIGWVEGAGYGLFLEIVGGIFVVAGIGEIWAVEAAAWRQRRTEKTMDSIHPAIAECEIPVFYATTEGQTRRIAEHLVAIFRENGFTSRAFDVASSDADYVDWARVRATVVGASLHAHRHQRAAEAFVREHAGDLNAHPSAFFSVSLAAASPIPAERDAAAQIASTFPARVGWHPGEITCVAGRLAYTQYGLLTRLVMKQIARRRGSPTDTSRDYEVTNWADVARLGDAVVRMVAALARQAA
jgi:menaquinone-dependent protoporphyrinogen oxidase